MLKTLDDNEIETFIMLLDLVHAVADKYGDSEDILLAGFDGLEWGLKVYAENKCWDRDFKVSTYISWFIKTRIEEHLGIESTDS